MDVRTTPMTLIGWAKEYGTALPATGANLLAEEITPKNEVAYLNVYFVPSKNAVLTVKRTRGGTAVSEIVSGTITANNVFKTQVPVRKGDSINFTCSVTAGTFSLFVEEVLV